MALRTMTALLDVLEPSSHQQPNRIFVSLGKIIDQEHRHKGKLTVPCFTGPLALHTCVVAQCQQGR